jgi:hypothetical protein
VRPARGLWPAADVVSLVAYACVSARGRALDRLVGGKWPAAGVVGSLFGTWAAARTAASGEHVDAPPTRGPKPVELIGHTGRVG